MSSSRKPGWASPRTPGCRKSSSRATIAKTRKLSHGPVPAKFSAGGSYFFTATLGDRRSRALIDHIDSLRAAVRLTLRAHPFTIDAIVILPDHLHIAMTLPTDDADYSTRLRLIKRQFTTALAKAGVTIARHRNGEYALWQRRFWEHTIRDEADFERHVDYIHFNPVKHGLVTRVSDWPHSSFHRYVRSGLLPLDWAGM